MNEVILRGATLAAQVVLIIACVEFGMRSIAYFAPKLHERIERWRREQDRDAEKMRALRADYDTEPVELLRTRIGNARDRRV